MTEWLGATGRVLRAFARCRSAAVAPLMALMLLPLAGGIAFAVELGGWNYTQRAMQNAADAAALAAASVNSGAATTGSTSQNEARAAARKFGFVDGTSNTTVTASTVTCPTGVAAGSTCYKATLSTLYPVLFSGALGFGGTDALGSGRAQKLYASAVATAKGGGGSQTVCFGTLGTGSSFTSDGGPKPDLNGCTIASYGNMTCNGHNLDATYGVAVGSNSGCGVNTVSNGSAFSNPYDALKSNIPSNGLSSCGGSFPQLSKHGNSWSVQSSNQISGTPAWTGTQKVLCGDVQLTGNVTLTGTTTMVIENGRLDLNGYTISTGSGAAATIVYSGDNTSTYSHYPTSLAGGGTIDIKAPTSGTWSGVAMYQDPGVTTNVGFTYTGNDPTWDISGLVYLPKADLTFSGAVNKSSNGASCFVLIAYTILVNGSAYIFANDTACASAGLGVPTVTVGSSTREKLVL